MGGMYNIFTTSERVEQKIAEHNIKESNKSLAAPLDGGYYVICKSELL